MPLPTFQDLTAQVGNLNGITVAWPAGHAIGDVALLICESCGGEPVTLSTPAGFVQAPNSPIATGSGTAGTQLTVFWCRATSTSMTSPVIADAGDHVIGAMVTFRGCRGAGNPIDVTATGVNAAAATSVTFPSLTTTTDNEMVVYIVTKDLDSGSNFASAQANANLGSVTERMDGGATQGNGGGISVTTGTKATAGSTGTGSATVTSSIGAFMSLALFGTTPPTTALDTADASVLPQPPAVLFTGTDADGDDLTYRVHIDNAIDRCPVGLGPTEDNALSMSVAGGNVGVGQSFQAPSSFDLVAATLRMSGATSPTGNMVAKIYAHSGTYGTSSIPTGAALGTSTAIDASTLGGSLADVTFEFATPVSLVSGTNYVLVVEWTPTGSQVVRAGGYANSAPSSPHAGNAAHKNGASWIADATTDLEFYLWAAGGRTKISKASASDAGFTDVTNGADTDPFASTNQIKYQIQAGDGFTGNGTFTWFAISKDTAGTNTWSVTPTKRTFTIPNFANAAHCTATFGGQAAHPQAFADTAGCTDTLIAGAGQSVTFTDTAHSTATLATHGAAVAALTDTAHCTASLSVEVGGQATAAFTDTAHSTATLAVGVSLHAAFADTAHCTATFAGSTGSGTTPPTGGDEWFEGGTPGQRASSGADTAGCTATFAAHLTKARAFADTAHCTATVSLTGRVGVAFTDTAHSTATLAVRQRTGATFTDTAHCTAVFVAHHAAIVGLTDTAHCTATFISHRDITRALADIAHCTATLAISITSSPGNTAVTFSDRASCTATFRHGITVSFTLTDQAGCTATLHFGYTALIADQAGCTALFAAIVALNVLVARGDLTALIRPSGWTARIRPSQLVATVTAHARG